MDRYEVRENTGWNANIRGLYVIVCDGWQRILSTEDYAYAIRITNDLNETREPVTYNCNFLFAGIFQIDKITY